MHLPIAALLVLLVSGSLTGATSLKQKYSWSADRETQDRAPWDVKNDCSGRGSFFTSLGGKAVCCSDKVRTTPPKDDACPLTWSWNWKQSCCIPPKPVCERDCGEGYVFNKIKMKCERKEVNKCGKGKWWHERNKECCDLDWGWDKGDCPKGKTCPKGWHWSKKSKRCKPDRPRSPEPDCDDWDDSNGCCGGGNGPKPTAHLGHGGGKNQGDDAKGKGGKDGKDGKDKDDGRDGKEKHERLALRQTQQVLFPQTETDKQYCPKQLHACSVNTPTGGEWAYECVDFATELGACGGCVDTGAGQDCTAILNARGVGCEAGACIVYTCEPGYTPRGAACELQQET